MTKSTVDGFHCWTFEALVEAWVRHGAAMGAVSDVPNGGFMGFDRILDYNKKDIIYKLYNGHYLPVFRHGLLENLPLSSIIL